MASSNFESNLSALHEAQETKALLKILTSVRKQVDWPKNKENIIKLRVKGCLKRLITVLQMSNKHVLDISLSILGNCMMEKGCARDAITTFNILSPLNQLVQRFPNEDSINGRIFRIIGNMCHHKDQWADQIIDRKSHLITYIVDFINRVSKDQSTNDNRFCEATVMMAIRALRVLVNKNTISFLVKKFGALKAIGSLFIKLSKDWTEKKENENILHNIIRLFKDYSRFKCYHSIIEMRNTERGDSLLHLSNVLLLSPKEIVEIIMNFIKISQLKSELPIPEICDKFIDEILANKFSTDDFEEDCIKYIQCLCYLLENPANRNSDRCGKCLPLLIKVLDSFQNPTGAELRCCILVLNTLKNCLYNEILIQEQLKCNVIDVLLKKLQWVVGSSDKLNVKHKIDKKRKTNTTLPERKRIRSSKMLLSPTSTISNDDSPRTSYFSDDDTTSNTITTTATSPKARSPSPCSSIGSDFSTWPYPSTSSPAASSYRLSESDSDDYSPVCSEADSTEFNIIANDTNATLVMDENDEETDEVPCLDDELPKEESGITHLKIILITKIALLLKSFASMHPPIQQLGTQELLLALLKCSEHFETTLTAHIDTVKVINAILLYNQFLIPLMKTKFIETIHDLKQIQHSKRCQKCSDFSALGSSLLEKISIVAESGAGKGDIAHILLRGNTKTKEELVLVIPYIIRDSNILARLMINCGGLKILMRLMTTNAELKDRSVKVLCALASEKLMISNPKAVTIKFNKKTVIKETMHEIIEDSDNAVTFKLDDGITVKADREFLSQKSEFFSSLLYGKFKESQEDVIALHNVDSKSFRCLLHLLKSKETLEMVDLRIDIDLDTLLDVIVLSDRFLMPDMCGSLINNVEKFKITAKTVPKIYKWSIESGTNYLRIETIAFALVAEIVDAERFAMFSRLLNLGYSDELAEDIEKLLVRYLNTIKTKS